MSWAGSTAPTAGGSGWVRCCNRTLGKAAATDVHVTYAVIDGRTVARIAVRAAAQPVFATPSKGDKKQAFFVRINNATHDLIGQDALDYQRKRWPASW